MPSAALIARLAHRAPDDALQKRALDDATAAVLSTLVDSGYIAAEDDGSGYVFYTITDAGRKQAGLLTAAGIAGAPGDHADNSGDVALWAWMLLNGGEIAPYSTSPSLTLPVWHLLACGLDLAKSGAVRDDVWTVWGGTFGADEREAGVSGHAVCLCGEIDLLLEATVPSVTDLLRQTLALG